MPRVTPELGKVHHGDVIDVLRTWPADSVQCVVTSPPYHGLRDYGLPPSVWGGDPSCDHVYEEVRMSAGNGTFSGNIGGDDDISRHAHAATRKPWVSGVCKACGAWKGCLGLEPTPRLYVRHLVDVFREVRRVLRPDGVCWLNLGDSFAANRTYQVKNTIGAAEHTYSRGSRIPDGLKPKDLVGVPWAAAAALRDPWYRCQGCGGEAHTMDWGLMPDGRGGHRRICPRCAAQGTEQISENGWWLRCDAVWAKRNCTPEAVEDRPTRSHEFVFLLAKSEHYFYDNHAVRERSSSGDEAQWDNGQDGHGGGESHAGQGSSTRKFGADPAFRNLRSVWSIKTVPFREAHFATFPEELAATCIKAGTSEHGACAGCGAPFSRVLLKPDMSGRPTRNADKYQGKSLSQGWGAYEKSSGQAYKEWREANPDLHAGWAPTCGCLPGTEPGDFELIRTPLGEAQDVDPSIEIGRAGLGRPRNEGAGVRVVTRWEQRDVARQLKASPNRSAMETEAGAEAFAHYMRTDAEGGRPVAPDLLHKWVGRGWVVENTPPDVSGMPRVRCVVADPFSGAGTAWLVAEKLGCDFAGVELNKNYIGMSERRNAQATLL